MIRSRLRSRSNGGGASGPSYDADAQTYITATGELFPDDLNTLVLGIKAAGLWDNHIGTIKKRIGLPAGSAGLTASMVDLRNPSFAGTAVNLGNGSATEGWDFTAASSQYFDSGWQIGATDSKATQDSTHMGWRVKAFTTGSPGRTTAAGSAFNGAGFLLLSAGLQRFNMNEGEASRLQTANANATGHWLLTRSTAAARAAYRDGVNIGSDTTASAGIAGRNQTVGVIDRNGTLSGYLTGRISLFHGGAGLDDTQAAAVTALFDAYATAAGEA